MNIVQAGMMELVDVLDSKSGEVKLVWVQAPLPVLQSDDFYNYE